MAKSTTLRHLAMLKLLPKYPAFILVKTLKAELDELGFDVSLRTLQRDLQTMQDVMGLDFCDSPEGLKWRFAKVNTELLPNMQPSEALLLVIAERYLKSMLPSGSISALEPRLVKARATLDQAAILGAWQDKLNVISGTLPLIPTPVDSQLRALIYDCVLQEEQLQIRYRKRQNEPPIEYRLNPQGIICRDHNHYLVASKLESPSTTQMFLLSKIKAAERCYSRADLSQMRSFSSFVADNPSGYLLADKQPVVLQVTGPAKRVLSANKLSKSQTVTDIDDGWLEVYAESVISYDLINWICQHAQAVRVIEPEILRHKVVSKLQQGLQNNVREEQQTMAIRRKPKVDQYAELDQPFKHLAKLLDGALEALNEIDDIVGEGYPQLPNAIDSSIVTELILMCEDCLEYVWEPEEGVSLIEAFEDLKEFCVCCDVSDIVFDQELLDELAELDSDEGAGADQIDDELKVACAKISDIFDCVSNL